MATFIGTNLSDRLFGTLFDDIIFGQGGNDRLQGRDGNDLIIGGTGRDYLSGDAGDDTLSGGDNHGFERDTVYGGSGDDLIWGNGDYINGGDDNDTIRLTTGGNSARGGDGNDALYGVDLEDLSENDNSALNYLYGNEGVDIIFGGTAREYIHGGDGNDFLFGGGNGNPYGDSDTLRGGDGNDYIEMGGIGPYGGLVGGTRDECAYGDDGNDTIIAISSSYSGAYGGAGHDNIHFRHSEGSLASGGNGHDEITFGTANTSHRPGWSTLTNSGYGDAGDDVLTAWFGHSASFTGGSGNDTFAFKDVAGLGTNFNGSSVNGPGTRWSIRDFQSGDKIDLSVARNEDGNTMEWEDLPVWQSNLGNGPGKVIPNGTWSDGKYFTLIEMSDAQLIVTSDEILCFDDFIF